MKACRGVTFLFAVSAIGCGTTVPPGQVALKYIAMDSPALGTEVLPDGFYWQWAWNSMIQYDVTTQSRDEPVHTLTKDNLHVPTTVTVTYHVLRQDIYKLHTTVGPMYYDELVGPAFVTLVRNEFAKHDHNDLAKESSIIQKEVLDALQSQMAPRSIFIDQVAIKHIDYDDLVTQSISKKIAMRQEAERKVYELEVAKRDAEIARAAASGRGDSVRIQAEGEAAATVLRGNAQAQAQQAIDKTLSTRYLQYKAFDNGAKSYYFVPTGRDGMPMILNAEAK
jgi:regulator of protease activity HflC (stomatin/prohibitin superfamily)